MSKVRECLQDAVEGMEVTEETAEAVEVVEAVVGVAAVEVEAAEEEGVEEADAVGVAVNNAISAYVRFAHWHEASCHV